MDFRRWTVLLPLLLTLPTSAQSPPPLLAEETIAALASEISGEGAKRNLEYLTRLHRMRASEDVIIANRNAGAATVNAKTCLSCFIAGPPYTSCLI